MKSPFAMIIAILSGLIVLAGYFFSTPSLINARVTMLDWAVTLAGMAALVSITHLIFGVHLKRVSESGSKRFFSLIVIITFLLTLAAGLYFGQHTVDFKRWSPPSRFQSKQVYWRF
jgi:hypothetical protein